LAVSPNYSWDGFPHLPHPHATGHVKSGSPKLALPLPPSIGVMTWLLTSV
jgi:hypothetical protein